MKKSVYWIAGIVVLGTLVARAEEAAKTAPSAVPVTIHIEKMAVGTAIDNKEISGEASTFGSSVTRLYCWTKISADQTPVSIHHVWSSGSKAESNVPLDIRYSPMRTWSSKSVWPGAWKVDVTDDQGKILASKEFTVSKGGVTISQDLVPPAKSAQPVQVGQ